MYGVGAVATLALVAGAGDVGALDVDVDAHAASHVESATRAIRRKNERDSITRAA